MMKLDQIYRTSHLLLLIGLVFISPGTALTSNHPSPTAMTITMYNWQEDIPQSVLDAFTRETKITVDLQVFDSQEEAVANISAGKIYDLAVIDSRFVARLIKKGLLSRLNYENLLNFKNISANFRGLTYDPENRYSVPYSWGTTGLLSNSQRLKTAVHGWADLWDTRYAGQVAISASYPRETIGLTLKSLGFSANSETPVEVEAALAKLLQLRFDPAFLYRYYPDFGLAAMTSNAILIAVGFSGDLVESRKKGLSVDYILPVEGLLLWADTFVIPKTSRHQAQAELLINFLLRPEISAAIVNEKYYASANEAAQPYVLPEILANQAIYPSDAMLLKAEIIEELSPTGQQLFDQAWQRFLAAYPDSQ